MTFRTLQDVHGRNLACAAKAAALQVRPCGFTRRGAGGPKSRSTRSARVFAQVAFDFGAELGAVVHDKVGLSAHASTAAASLNEHAVGRAISFCSNEADAHVTEPLCGQSDKKRVPPFGRKNHGETTLGG